MEYKLIAIDIDDTLITNEGNIPQRVVNTIQKAKDIGIHVVLATGRIKTGAQRYYEKLGLDTLFITAGGAEVYDVGGKGLYLRPVDTNLIKKILTYSYEKGLHPQVYIDGELVYRDKNKYALKYEESYGLPGIVMPDIMEKEQIVTPKVLIVLDEDKNMSVKKDLQKLFPTLAIVRSKPMYIELAHRDVSKGEALKFVAEYYNVKPEQIIAVGDSEIDISMLKFAGLGVCVSNAHDDVKKVADIVCASNEQGGVADIIEKYILEAKA